MLPNAGSTPNNRGAICALPRRATIPVCSLNVTYSLYHQIIYLFILSPWSAPVETLHEPGGGNHPNQITYYF